MALTDRMIRASKADLTLYQEVERDPTATNEALTVVALVAAAGGISGLLAALTTGHPGAAIGGLIGGIIISLILWVVDAWLIYFIGTRMFHAQGTFDEVLRTIGFAQSPRVLEVLAFIPVLGPLIRLIVGIWTLYLSFIAVREGLEVSSGEAIATIVIAIVVALFVITILAIPLALIGLAGAIFG